MTNSKFRMRIFDTPVALFDFVAAAANFDTIVSITTDNNGKQVLYYLVP